MASDFFGRFMASSFMSTLFEKSDSKLSDSKDEAPWAEKGWFSRPSKHNLKDSPIPFLQEKQAEFGGTFRLKLGAFPTTFVLEPDQEFLRKFFLGSERKLGLYKTLLARGILIPFAGEKLPDRSTIKFVFYDTMPVVRRKLVPAVGRRALSEEFNSAFKTFLNQLPESGMFDSREFFSHAIACMTARALLGADLVDHADQLVGLIERLVVLVTQSERASWAGWPMIMFKAGAIHREFRKILEPIIRQRRRWQEENPTGWLKQHGLHDLLSYLLDAFVPGKVKHLTADQVETGIRMALITGLFGAFANTVAAVEGTLLCILNDPNIYDEVVDDIINGCTTRTSLSDVKIPENVAVKTTAEGETVATATGESETATRTTAEGVTAATPPRIIAPTPTSVIAVTPTKGESIVTRAFRSASMRTKGKTATTPRGVTGMISTRGTSASAPTKGKTAGTPRGQPVSTRVGRSASTPAKGTTAGGKTAATPRGEAARVDSIMANASLKNFPFLQACFTEFLRVNPSTFFTRMIEDKPMELPGGYIAKPGTMVAVVPWMIMHDPKRFPNPHTFDPYRVYDESFAAAERDLQYISFGAGLHKCKGMKLAFQEIKVALGMLIRDYHVELADPFPGIPLPHASNVPSPNKSVRIKFTKRACPLGTVVPRIQVAPCSPRRRYSNAMTPSCSNCQAPMSPSCSRAPPAWLNE